MLHEPEVLFLDEPTIGLDIVVKEKVRDAILKLNKEKGTTIFLTSHDLGDIEKLCQRIIIIDKGCIIKDESLENLKQEYLKERFITLKYEENMENVKFEYPIIDVQKNKVIIKIDTSKFSVSEILEKFMKYGNVVDLEATPVPLEEVIYEIYTREES
jgi:ABC-2 type transport system ATP-binding protein